MQLGPGLLLPRIFGSAFYLQYGGGKTEKHRCSELLGQSFMRGCGIEKDTVGMGLGASTALKRERNEKGGNTSLFFVKISFWTLPSGIRTHVIFLQVNKARASTWRRKEKGKEWRNANLIIKRGPMPPV